MTHLRISICLFFLLLLSFCYGQQFNGYWQGELPISKQDSLTIGLYISQDGDSIIAEFDSPEQYATGLPATVTHWDDSTLEIKSPSIHATFKGKLVSGGRELTGTFQQGAKLPLTLRKGFERTIIYRPQTPKAPFPYREEEIGIKDASGKFNLINGTLTMPEGEVKALVILISGSGWQDRDETLFGHKPFWVIADHLTRNGFAVFRYDDYPANVFVKSTTFDFADGVTMILDSFARRAELGELPTGLLGHSEGSMIAEVVAARDSRVQFVITLGGVAQRTSDVLLYQVRALNEADGNLSTEEIENSVRLSESIYKILAKAKDPKQAAEQVSKEWDLICSRLNDQQKEKYGFSPERKKATLAQVTSPWFFTFFHFDPKKYIKKIKCPFLAIGGEKDLQVDTKANNSLFLNYLPKKSTHTFVCVDQANHLLQPCTTGSNGEYGEIETTLRPEVLTLLTQWLNSIGY